MRIGRATIVPAILTLSMAGAALSVPVLSVVASTAPAAQVQIMVSAAGANARYHS